MLKKTGKRIKDLPLNKIAPNMVTMMALCSGVTSIRYATEGRFQLAVFFILMAAVFDALDGRVARFLRGASDFGAELDSLSDVVCFGVAPGVLMYMWALSAADSAGWPFALLMPVCCALRLARFNVMLDEEPQPSYWHHFFVGLPAPGGAFIALTPAMLYFEFGCDFFKSGWFVELFLFASAMLMASRLPTISLKHIRLPVRLTAVVMAFAGFYTGALFYKPWLVLSLTFLGYLISVPLCSYVFLRLKAKTETPEQTEQAEA